VLTAAVGATVVGVASPAWAAPLGVTGVVQQVIVEKTGGGDDHLTLVVDARGAHAVSGLENVPTGSRVRATLGATLSATGERPIRSYSVVATAPTATAPTAAAPNSTSAVAATPYAAKPVIVVPVRWTGVEPDKTGQQVADIVTRDANPYWQDASGGSIGFTVSKIVAPVTLPGSWCTSTGGVSSTALEQVHAAAGVKVGATGGAHVLAYSKNVSACGWAGLATVSNNNPGAGGWVMVNGLARLDVVGHELGHNLGLGHSNLRWCADASGTRFSDGSTGCTQQAYRDPYDIMGIAWGTSGNLNAAQRDQLGLLSPGGITDLSSGSVTLAPLGNASGLRAARVVDGTARYWLEYRTKAGRDSWIDGSPATSGYAIPGSGVVVHRADTLKAGGGTDLIDGNPVGAKLDRAALRAGEKWTSPSGKVTVTVVSTSATGAVVRVGGVAPGPFSLTGVPSTPAATQDSVVRSGAVTVNWSASDDNGSGIARYEIVAGDAVLATAAPDARSATVTLGAGRHTVTVRAVDTTGNTRTASNSVRYLVDPTAPVVSTVGTVFRTGTAGTTLPVTTSWAAADPGSGICAQQYTGAAGTPFAFPATARAAADVVPGGAYRWGVTATDCAGNASSLTGTGTAAAYQENALRYTSRWSVAKSGAAYGGAFQSTAVAGASASGSVKARSVALVASQAANQGAVRVYVDNKLVATVDLYSARGATSQVVWTYAWPTVGNHTVKVVNVGTKSRPRANVDALLGLS
jgi:hypothetical protein